MGPGWSGLVFLCTMGTEDHIWFSRLLEQAGNGLEAVEQDFLGAPLL